MSPMSDSKAKSKHRRQSSPQDALSALLSEPAGDPIRRAEWLGELDRRLHPHLPPSLAPHARLANVKEGTLVFVVDAPVWRTKLRLAAPELLDVARSIGLVATEVVVKVSSTPHAPPERAPLQAIPLSSQSRRALQAALDTLRPAPEEDGES
ncbi:DUF721 domain-containing protein [Lysobacter spongiae]|uniref:DUF721 domain-containing protein n=2 Tax=Marilutibacter spongiae TaxID=2025720 RepID=A0A7W3Y4H6_9GAMM|nr:DUF721 domain-containing protein [Lysobacter spongiae]